MLDSSCIARDKSKESRRKLKENLHTKPRSIEAGNTLITLAMEEKEGKEKKNVQRLGLDEIFCIYSLFST